MGTPGPRHAAGTGSGSVIEFCSSMAMVTSDRLMHHLIRHGGAPTMYQGVAQCPPYKMA